MSALFFTLAYLLFIKYLLLFYLMLPEKILNGNQ